MADAERPVPWLWQVLAVLAGVGVNVAFSGLNHALQLPLFLDSVGTVAVAATIGLVPGLLVGGLTNLTLEAVKGFPGIVAIFGLVNMATAVVTWLFVSRGFFRTLFDALWVVFALALTNALLGSLIVTVVFGGFTDEPLDNVVRSLMITGESLFTSAFLGRVFINVVDKGVAVLAAFAVYHTWRSRGPAL